MYIEGMVVYTSSCISAEQALGAARAALHGGIKAVSDLLWNQKLKFFIEYISQEK